MKNRLMYTVLFIGLLILSQLMCAQQMSIVSSTGFSNPQNLIDGTDNHAQLVGYNGGDGNIVVSVDELYLPNTLEIDVSNNSSNYTASLLVSDDNVNYSVLGSLNNGINEFSISDDIKYIQIDAYANTVLILNDMGFQLKKYIAYSYDAVGNRVRRSLEIGEIPQLKSTKDENNKKQRNNLNWDELGLKLYPNPTHGELILEFENYPEDKRIKAELYNSAGKKILNEKINNNNTMLNIENYPEGMYMMHLYVSGEQKTYKIIKK